MPGDDADFAAYLAARWPAIVRTLVLLGGSRAEAEQVARAALARCCGSWEHVRREDDVDAQVYREVLACWHRSRRHASPAPRTAPVEEPTDLVLLRRALEAELDRLDAEEREVLVLRFVAELDELQVADALDVPLDSVRDRLSRGLGQVDLDALQELGP
jgi:DNA-directed RNA polymerase specialized sigma24 family protein